MYLFLSTICAIWVLTSAHVGDHVPPKLPDRFSLRMESIDHKGRQISDTAHVVDYAGKFMRSDLSPRSGVYARSLATFGNRPLIVINDFNTGHEFVIDRWWGNCSTRGISVHNRAAIIDSSNHILGMKHPYEIFQREDMMYNGTTTIRGLPVEIYSGMRNKTQVSVYYLRNPWGSVTEQDEHPQEGVPVAMNFTGYDKAGMRVSRRINIYDFTKDHTELSTVPVYSCFKRFRTVNFRLDDNLGIHRFSGVSVKYSITTQIAKAMNVSFFRVKITSIYVSKDNIKPGYTLIVFRIYDPITAPDHLARPVVETSIAKAIQNLKSLAYRGLTITVPDIKTQDRLTVIPNSVIYSSSQTFPSYSSRSTTTLTTTSTNGGLVAGVGIALLIVGLAAGFAAAFFFRKKFPCDKGVPYAIST
ncbi:uncharacterized protein LOC135462914 [Liolophura sinensis]|uniref:uncharacterized protein LOC135462914 n=1 Tax=Liolophura sinensis TaxID=3198878 RepID=UPI003157FAC8